MIAYTSSSKMHFINVDINVNSIWTVIDFRMDILKLQRQ